MGARGTVAGFGALVLLLGWGAAVDAAPRVEMRLVLEKDTLHVGEVLTFRVELRNLSSETVTVVRPVDGSFEGMREPLWGLEFLDAGTGELVPRALGHAPEGRCGLVNSLEADDRITLAPGASVTLAGKALEWVPPQKVRPSALPGPFGVRLRYRVTEIEGVTPLDLRSPTVSLAIRGGDAALWRCREDQLARRLDHDYVSAGPVRLYARDGGEGYVVFYAISSVRVVGGKETTSRRVLVQALDARGAALGTPTVVMTDDDPGYLAVAQTPEGWIFAHTPGAVGGRAVEVLRVTERDGRFLPSPRRPLSAPPGNPYVVGLVWSPGADRAALAFEGPEPRGAPLMVQLLDRAGRPSGKPRIIARKEDFAGFVSMVATADGFLVAWTAGAEKGRMQVLDAGGTPVGETVAFAFGGQMIAALDARADHVEIVYSDASYSGSDLTDTMGLYRLRLALDGRPMAEPEPLSPRDRQEARFGHGAWLADGRFARVYGERGPAFFGIGSREKTTRLTDTAPPGGTIAVWAAGDRFLVAWPDHRDDTSPACTALGECSFEAYVAAFDARGRALLPPTRLTHQATARPVAPYRDWERFCGD